jgi:hypothetical protein
VQENRGRLTSQQAVVALQNAMKFASKLADQVSVEFFESTQEKRS